jgi:hypothetical protein
MSAHQIEDITEQLIKKSGKEMIQYLQELNLLKRELQCIQCHNFMSINKNSKKFDTYSWRCQKRTCSAFKKYVSIRKDSFFENISCSFKHTLQIVLCYTTRQQRHSILRSIPISKPAILKIIK